ncbi:hypothetical protein [Spirillospora sp. CA-294931]|uniref:hypothetical protein n=1 Tax=Spirillospora sp. CA-294931 TaxID=3240042 RepID=UPI003D8EBDCE
MTNAEGQPPALGQHVWARRDAFVAARDIYVTAVLSGAITRTEKPPNDRAAYQRERPIFVQYTNPEILACYGKDVKAEHAAPVLAHALDATRLALLLTERHLIIPASFLFEIPWYPTFLGCLEPLVHAGAIRYTAPVPDLEVYREMKAHEYRNDPLNPYPDADLGVLSADADFAWTARNSGRTADSIGDLWKDALQPGGDLHGLILGTARRWHRSHGRVERLLARTPERLEGQAFIGRFVEPTLPARISSAESALLALFISRAYLRSYLLDLDAALLVDLPMGDLACGLATRAEEELDGRWLSALRLESTLRWLGTRDFVHRFASWEELLRLRALPEFGLVIDHIYRERSTTALRIATLRTRRRSTCFKNARTYAEAESNVIAVADTMSDL